MNVENCPPGWATDQVFIFNNPVGTCDMPVPAYILLGVILTTFKGILTCLHIKEWRRRQRKLYAKMDRQKHHPFVPTLSFVSFMVYATFFPLTFANVVNSGNGWSYALHSIGWVCFGLISIFFLFKIVRLGRRLVPIIKEKRRNEMLEQLQRDEDDPPTYSSSNKKPIGPFTSNPIFDDDPPTYDENSSSQPAIPPSTMDAHTGFGAFFPYQRAFFNQQVSSGRQAFEKSVQSGKKMIGKRVQSGRSIFSMRPRVARKPNKKTAMEPSTPIKNPYWEEDPPTTYSILEIVEPQIDRLKKMDVLGKLFFFNEASAVFIQFFINFFVLTFIRPNDYYIAQISFAFQTNFLMQHAVAMNWQFGRVIMAVRESRRKSRRNENVETGLKKLRGQQMTIFILASFCSIIYLIQAIGVVKPNWYYAVIVMYFEVLANFIIYRTLSTRLRGKINELKKQRAKANAAAKNNGKPNGNNEDPNTSPIIKNGALVPSPKMDLARLDRDANDGNSGDKPGIVKSSVAHVRESAKFATTELSRRGDDMDDKDENTKSTAVSW